MEEILNNLREAIKNENRIDIENLLEATKRYKYFHTLYTDVIFNLIKFDDPKLIKFAVDCGAGLNYPYSEKLEKPLHIAAQLNKIQIVSFLINKGINPDVLDRDHNTPLFFAAASGSREAIEFLITYNANINHSNIFGKTPLIEAVNSGNKDIVSLLLNNEANPNTQDSDGTTALMLTQINAMKNARKYIVGHSIDNIDYSHASKKQKLENPFEEIIRKLLSCGASLFLENNQGKTVLNLALPYFYEIIHDALSAVNITEKFLGSTNASENEGLKTPNISELLNVIEKGVTGDALTTTDIDSLKNNGLEEALYGFLEDIKQASEENYTTLYTITNSCGTGNDDFKINSLKNGFLESLSQLLKIDSRTIRYKIVIFIATHPELYLHTSIRRNIPQLVETIRTDIKWVPDAYVSAAATALQTSIIIHLPNDITYDIINTQTSKALHLLYKETKYTPLIMEERREETNSHSL